MIIWVNYVKAVMSVNNFARMPLGIFCISFIAQIKVIMGVVMNKKTIYLLASSVVIVVFLVLGIQPAKAAPPTFVSSNLIGENVNNPTVLEFGPDGRLYVAQQNGTILIYTIQRNSPTSYQVIATETVDLVRNITNHNDDGIVNNGVNNRQVTGLIVRGTAANPVLYVTSSDSRIATGNDANLDTNSGTLSRLTWTGSAWQKVDLVRGLPRNEHNHATNGLTLDPTTNTIYIAQGGHTNMGAPSNNFAFQPEYALSAAILSVNLTAIEALPTQTDANGQQYKYDLPTLNDPTRPDIAAPSAQYPFGIDQNDPFGGNNGHNQAIILPGGPVQVYSPGYRNPYDIELMTNGLMYTIDNSHNPGWGGPVIGEGTSNCTNEQNDNNSLSSGDNLHLVTAGYYAGHPNPVRGNPIGANLYDVQIVNGNRIETLTRTFTAGDTPVPFALANPVECDHRVPGVDDGALAVYPASTNGIVEYTASNFGDEMKGDLLAASFNGNIYRMKFTANGTALVDLDTSSANNYQVLFSGFGSTPLDIDALGDAEIFPGTVWVATYGSDNITVFEPTDFFVCSGADDPLLDEDSDGYSNADEIDNNTDPCSGGSKPNDNDGDFVSDRNDNDDDNDGILDPQDAFAIDPTNGLNTTIPLNYGWAIGDPGTGLFGMGFTGLMKNNTTDYLDQFDPDEVTAGGAAGKFTVNAATSGDALNNNQDYAFQFGVKADGSTGPFTVRTRLESPYFNSAPTGNMSQGIYIGTGDQDNYLKIVMTASGTIDVVSEIGGVASSNSYPSAGILASTFVDFYLSVNPVTGQVQPKAAINGGAITDIGSPLFMPLSWFSGTNALAVGIIATSNGATPFSATWDQIDISLDPISAIGTWEYLSASGPVARQDGAYVKAGDKFYLIGGRGSKPVNIYDPTSNTWTGGATPPIELYDFQAVELNGLIYVIGAFTTGDLPADSVYIYNPIADTWHTGSQIPPARRRGGAAAVVHQGKIYLIGGASTPAGATVLVDAYHPTTNTWTIEADMPRTRAGFDAIVVGNNLYAIGGHSNAGGLHSRVDVFNFSGNAWSTLSPASNLPTPRDDVAVEALGGEILVIGGHISGTAQTTTEALDVATGTWRTVATLNEARSSTQALVCNGNIYIAAGLGGGELASHERYYFFTPTACPATTLTNGVLSATPNPVNFGQIATNNSAAQNVVIRHSSGNQAVIINNITLSGDSDFSMTLPYTAPIVLGPGESITVPVTFAPTSGGIKNGVINVNTANSGTLNIDLIGEGATPPSFRVNAGGPALTSLDAPNPDWSANTGNGAQGYVNTGSVSSTGATITLHASVPAYVPPQLFQTERWDPTAEPSMQWDFPVSPGNYEVRLYFAETYSGASQPGQRIFDVTIEGLLALDNYDIVADVGYQVGVMKSFPVTVSDTTLDIDFSHVVENPAIKGIEIIPLVTLPNTLPVANDDTATTVQGVDVIFDIIANDVENDFGDAIDGNAVDLDLNTNGDQLSLTISGEGTYSYYPLVNQLTFAPEPNFTGISTISYTVRDMRGGVSNAATVTVTVSGPNEPPLAVNDTASTLQGADVTIDFIANDSDPTPNDSINPDTIDLDPVANGQQQSVTITNTGTFTYNSTTDTLVFSPEASFIGLATTTYTVQDSYGSTSNVALITVEVTALCPAIYRVNAGGPSVTATDGGINWEANTTNGATTYVNIGTAYSVANTITPNSSVPPNTPLSIFQSERYDPNRSNPTMNWAFPVTAGNYIVRLYFAELYFTAVGQRSFDVRIEGTTVLNDYDMLTEGPQYTGIMKSFNTTSDATLNIVFAPGPANNAKVNAIEILPTNCATSNTPPSAVDDSANTPENTPIAIDFLANDTDPDAGDSLVSDTIDLDPSVAGQQLTLTVAGGTFTYDLLTDTLTFTPALDYVGMAIASYTVRDNRGATSNTATITVDVTPVNDSPIANNDSAQGLPATPIVIDFVSNDSDPEDGAIDPDTLDLDLATAGQQSTLTLINVGVFEYDSTTNTLTFTSESAFNGPVTITYIVTDSAGLASNQASITVLVNTPPIATDDTATATEALPAVIDFLANDSDPDTGDSIIPDSLDLDPSTSGQQTTLTLTGIGVFAYDTTTDTLTFTSEVGYTGAASATYTINDSHSATSNVATITVTIAPANLPPVANDDTASTPQSTAVTIPFGANDSDPDTGDSIVLDSIDLDPATSGQQTTLTLAEGVFDYDSTTDTLTFTPASGYVGLVGASYTVSDTSGAVSNIARISIDVTNTPPIAGDDTATTTQDTPLTIDFSANDSDPDAGDSIVLDSIDLDPTAGGQQTTLSIASGIWAYDITSDTLSFTPTAGFTGNASINYTVQDTHGATSNIALISVTVNPASAACGPLSPNDCSTIPVSITPDFCLTWDSGSAGGLAGSGFTMVDPPSSPLTPPTNPSVPGYEPNNISVNGGHLVIRSTKGIQYRHPAVSSETNSQVNALGVGFDASSPITITATLVNPAFNTSAGNNAQQAGIWFGLNENNYVKLVATKVTGTTGRIQLAVENYGANPTGPVPVESNSANIPSITTATITLTLNLNPATGEATATYTINGGAPVALGPLAVPSSFFSGQLLPDGTTGPVSFAGLFTTHRRAAADQFIDFRFDDFCIALTNTPPVADDDSASTVDNTPLTINVLDGDTDADGTLNPASVTLVDTTNLPSGHSLVVNPDGSVSYTPLAPYSGSFTFTYTVQDDLGATSNVATVTVTVTASPTNTPPVADDDSASTTINTPVTLSIVGNDSDPDAGDAPNATTVDIDPDTAGQQLNRIIAGQGTFDYDAATDTLTFTPENNFTGAVAIEYTVNDGFGATSNRATITITIATTTEADLSLTKFGDMAITNPTQVGTGDTIDYRLTVTNDGPADATNITLRDTLSDHVTLNAVPTDCIHSNANSDGSGGELVCVIANLAATTQATILYSTTVTSLPSNSGNAIVNIAEITAVDQNDPDSTPNNGIATEDDYATFAAPAIFDPPFGRKSFNDDGTPVLEWTMVWFNPTPLTATNVVITDTIPAGMAYDSGPVCNARGASVTTICAFDSATNTIRWEGSIAGTPVGGDFRDNRVEISFRVRIGDNTSRATNVGQMDIPNFGGAPFSTTVQRQWERGQTAPDEDNTDNAPTAPSAPVITPPANISVSADPAVAPAGSDLNFTINVTNTGSGVLNNLVIDDLLPPDFTIVSATATAGAVSINGQGIMFTLDLLQPGQTVTILIRARVKDTASATINIFTACVRDAGGAEACDSAQVLGVTTLPKTGETPWWRVPLLTLIALMMSIGWWLIQRRFDGQRQTDVL